MYQGQNGKVFFNRFLTHNEHKSLTASEERKNIGVNNVNIRIADMIVSVCNKTHMDDIGKLPFFSFQLTKRMIYHLPRFNI